MIQVDEVRKNYGHVQAVRGVSFEVNQGEVFGLLGPNGAGKTTILRMLTGYHFPSSGTARVNGHDVYVDPISVKSSIGYLPESAPLYTELNVMEYLEFIAQARNIPPSERAGRIEWAVSQCGLEEVVYRSIDNLSKGYRQRTGLAQAIIHDPAILILDEPTTGLDPNQIIEIRRLIRELGREKTVILSTHILQEVEAVCDRVLILADGQVAAEGTTGEIASEMKGEDVFNFRLKGGSAAAVQRSLEKLPLLGRIEHVTEAASERGAAPASEADTLVDCQITMSDGDSGEASGPPPEGGEAVFDWAVENGYKLLSLERKRYSLEDIFIRLTTQEPTGEERQS